MLLRHVNLAFLSIALLGIAPGRAQETPPETPESQRDPSGEKLSEARIKFMQEALGRHEIRVGDDPEPLKLHPTPVLRWSNPVSGTKDGILGVFSQGGRPLVMAQFSIHSRESQIQEFYSLTDRPLEMSRGGQTIWKPEQGIFYWQELKGGPVPAKSEKLRLPQFRRLAAEFSVIDDFGWKTKEKHSLRLMTQPMFRYSDKEHGVVDGAVFAFTLGTDPEAILLLELLEKDGKYRWQFGFSPMSIYALTAAHKNKDVWSIEERRIFNSFDRAFRVGPYPPEPGVEVPE